MMKFATLLQQNWLAENPQPLALMGLADGHGNGADFWYQLTAGKTGSSPICLQSEHR
ncbi:hypothetical protein [Peribacillus frigoritolerans]|uniref:hypothetical protein n=1 Tax=Peribacillus frigoritolerans TaxID=450367 RepID=UPI003D9FB8FA